MTKRESYSVHQMLTVCHGAVTLKDRLHVQLVVLVETLPGVDGYSIYSPTFTYESNGKERKSSFTVAARLVGGQLEFWNSTWDPSPDPDSPLERARNAHAQHLGATHRLFTLADLEANWVANKNRQTLQAFLVAGYATDTREIETKILMALRGHAPTSLRELSRVTRVTPPLATLASFRLIVAGRLNSQLETKLISPEWQVWRCDYAHAHKTR